MKDRRKTRLKFYSLYVVRARQVKSLYPDYALDEPLCKYFTFNAKSVLSKVAYLYEKSKSIKNDCKEANALQSTQEKRNETTSKNER